LRQYILTFILLTIKTEAVAVASKVTGLEANAEKTKYTVMSRDHNAGKFIT
jgi:hypothetical protein